MNQIPQEKVFLSHSLSQNGIETERMTNDPMTYETESLPSSADVESDEVDTQDVSFSSALSFEDLSVPIKAEPSDSPLSKRLSGVKTMRTPTIFAPRSPNHYNKSFRKSFSDDAIPSQNKYERRDLSPSPTSTLPPSQSWSDSAFESPRYPSKSDLFMHTGNNTMSTDGTFKFPSPFSTPNKSMTFGDFSMADINNDQEEEHAQRSIRRISEGDAFEPISSSGSEFLFHQSMDLVDVFASVSNHDFRSSRSMPEIFSPFSFESSPKGKIGNGSGLEEAMAIDPFDDNCVQFEQSSSEQDYIDKTTIAMKEDFEMQLQALRIQHEQEVNILHREIETGNRIITALTKQVQELMARNEKLSAENKKAKESKRHSSSSHKKKVKKASTDDTTISTPETMNLDNAENTTSKKRPSKGTSTKKKEKSKRSSKHSVSSRSLETQEKSKKESALSVSTHSLEVDEHPLSFRRKSKPTRHSIATTAIEKGNKKHSKASSKRLSDTIENIWAFDWKDPGKLESKRESHTKKKHHLEKLKENLEASVGKLPKRTGKRRTLSKSSKDKPEQATTDKAESSTAKISIKSPIKKAKKISRRSLAAVGRLLSPTGSEKRRKRTKTDLEDLSRADLSGIQKLEAVPEL